MEQGSSQRISYTLTDWLVPLLIMLGVAVLFYCPLLLGLRTFPHGDFTHHFLPFSLFQRAELLAGRLPIWNPYTFSGHPFLADTQAALFYPINGFMLMLSLPFEGLFGSLSGARLYFLQVEVVIHIALAGLFTFLLVFDLTRNRMAGLFAGIAFAFSGYLTSYPPLQLAVLRTAIWLPLILFLLRRGFLFPQERRWWLGFIVATASAFMAGHPQTMLHSGYVIGAWILLLFTLPIQDQSSTFRTRIIRLNLSVLAIVGLCMVQLLPSAEYLGMSVRAETSYEFVSAGFPLRDTWQLLLPGVFTWFSPLYISVIGLGIAVCAFGSAKQQGQFFILNRYSLFFGGIVTIALLLSYGRNGLLYPVFYRFAPGWDLFRQQERSAYLVTLGLSVLVGLGYASLPVMPLKRRRLLIAVYTALVIGGVYGFGLLWQLPGETVISNARYLAIATGTLVGAMLLAVMVWWDGWDQRRANLLLGLTVVNLFIVNITTNLDSFGPTRKTILAPEMEALQTAIQRRTAANVGLPGRVYNEFRIYDDYGMALEIEDIWGSSPLRLAHYAELFEEFPLDRLWRLTGVEHVLTWRQQLFEPSELLAEFPQAEDTTYLHRLTELNPRAWLVSNVYTVPPEEEAEQAIALLADHGFNLETSSFIARSYTNVPQIGTGSGIGLGNEDRIEKVSQGATEIKLVRQSPTQLSVSLNSNGGGFLVLSENYMPGYRVDSVACNGSLSLCEESNHFSELPPLFELQRANLTLIGLTVPAGEVVFDLVYAPQSVQIGLWISAATLVLLFVVGITGWVQRHRSST